MRRRLSNISQAPNFFSIASNRFSRSYKGKLIYRGASVKVNQIIAVDTSDTGAASAWTKKAQNGDMFFVYCKRGVGCDWRQYHLPSTLATRGIYALAKSESGPYKYSVGRTAIKVRVVALLRNHVPQFEINGNPKTYWATPYRGNRNDAIQRHPDETNKKYCPHPDQGLEFVKMILTKNPGLKKLMISEWPYLKNKV